MEDFKIMAKQVKQTEENIENLQEVSLLELDNLDLETKDIEYKIPIVDKKEVVDERAERRETKKYNELINCLRNEKVIVRFVPRAAELVTNPKHTLYGGLAEHAFREYTVPRLQSNGQFVNVLTNEEKEYLEYIMELEPNALSIHKRTNNFWGSFKIRLKREDKVLDLSNPNDYIAYKVLRANSDFIAASLEELEDSPKATHQFVLILENEESKSDMKKLSYSMQAYMLVGKLQDNLDVLKLIIEQNEGRPVSSNIKLEVAIAKIQNLIIADAKSFVRIATDPLLTMKVLIRKSVEVGLILRRGTYYYLTEGNTPLCEANEEPTLTAAAKYLLTPKRQELKFMLEAKTKK